MTGTDHGTYFTQGPAEKLIQDAKAQEDAMWPIIDRVASSHLQSRASVVIDWWLLSPRRVASNSDERVSSIWLYIEPDVLLARERSNSDFLSASDEPEKMLDHFMARSLWRNDLVRVEACGHGLPLLTVSTQTVDELTAEALSLLQ
jgi:hypothetical protein